MIQLNGITKTYRAVKDVPVLKGVDFTLGENEFVAVMGKSGCGKSTLLNIIGCLDGYSGGEYLLNGSSVDRFSPSQKAAARRDIFGFVFQGFHLLPTETVLQNVMLPLRYSSLPKKDHANAAHQALASLGIDALAGKYPTALSGGEQQRVAIARALVHSPAVLLADEPTGNLDAETGKQIMKTLLKLHTEQGKSILLVTHDVKIASYADRIIEMRNGMIAHSIDSRGETVC